MKKIKMYCAHPSTGNRLDAQCYMLRKLEEKYKDQVEFVYPEQHVQRIFHDFARNELVEEFLESDCDVMWFLDSDIKPHQEVLSLITDHFDKWEIAGAVYPIWMKDKIVFTAYRQKNDDGGLEVTAVPTQGIGWVDGLATGCLFIKKSVFDRLERPWFEFKYDPINRMMIEGEDLGFAKRCLNSGLKFFTNFALVCGHYKTVDLLDCNNYTMDFASDLLKEKMQAYDKMIHEKLQLLEETTRSSKERSTKLVYPASR